MSAGIDCLLLKGTAHYAEGLAPATRRILGDVDILVRPRTVMAASDRLLEAGWSGNICDDLQRRLSINLRKGEFGQIDLHRSVFHFCRRDPDLDADLWEKARPARLAGKPVLVPSPADSIVISIAHGLTDGLFGDWALDVGYRGGVHQIDWDSVVHIADRRGIASYVLAGLTYIKSLGVEIPQSILSGLHAARSTRGEKLKYIANTTGRKYWCDTLEQESVSYRLQKRVVNAFIWRLGKRIDQLANTLLPRHEYLYWGASWDYLGNENF
jgi:hypothetical protein